MPRIKRIDLAGVTQHVVQRGNDRQACFFHERDYMRYLQDLRESSLQHGCRLHAYVLMTNHVHLLVTPSEPGAVSRMMQTLGRRYVRYVNDTTARTGTLWEGRFKSSLVDSERYVLACYRYIELNPVRACIVADAADYRWSSYRCNAHGAHDALLVAHAVYQALATEASERQQLYRELLTQAIPEEELAAIRLHVARQRALGSDRFHAQIEQQIQRRARIGRPGRPRRQAKPELVL